MRWLGLGAARADEKGNQVFAAGQFTGAAGVAEMKQKPPASGDEGKQEFAKMQ